MTGLPLNARSMLSYFSRETYVGTRRLARISIAVCVSVFVHLVVLILFSQSGVGIVPGYRGGVQVYLPAAASQDARTEKGRSEVPAERSVEPSPTPLSKAVPPVANEPKPRRRTEPSPTVRKNEIPSVAASLTTATVAQQNVPNVPQMRVESGGGALNGGQLKRVSIDFDVLSGTDRRLLSRGRHVYVAEREYFGISVSDVPLAGQVGKDGWRIEISGRVNVQGLSPILYETRGALPQELMALRDGGTNRHAVNQALQRKWQMPDGVLDRQSLLYHFMFKPPELTGGNVWLSDGSSHALYAYRMAGTESLPIAGVGNVSTLKLLFTTSASQERIELWLLPDRHYLPLKARYVDGLGAVTEQTATSIDFE
jgi:hypothetical protein